MSWGTRIAILYGAFVVMILALVYRTSIEDSELETPDYYARELKFQDQIDAQSALLQSGVAPTVSLTEDFIHLQIPAALYGDDFKGTVTFYRPDDVAKDRMFNLSAADSQFERTKFSAGNYQVRITWSSGGQNYYHETDIQLP